MGYLACDFCPNVFESIADKNSHLLEHFVQELCNDCNESLIRIGDSLYVLHTKITCIKSNDSECQDQQTPSPQIEVNPKNEIFIDEQHFDESPPPNVQTLPENQNIEEITIDDASSIKIEPMFFDSNYAVENSMLLPLQQNDDDKISEPTKSTKAGQKRNKNRLRWEKEIIECPIDGCGQMIKRVYKPRHIKEKHGAGFKCNTCDTRFMTSGTLQQHIKQCVISEKFTCEFCLSSYISKKSLAIHKYENHKSEKEKVKQTNTRAKRSEYLKTKIKCDFSGCDVMMRKNNMSKHLKDHHGSGVNCTECGKVFLWKERLEKHMLLHAIGAIHYENFTCEHCQEVFSDKNRLITHMRHHIPKNEREECKICGSKCIDKAGLRRHMRYHAESQFVCRWCAKEFKIKTHLTDHERIHSGERPFKCGFDCGKTFRTSALKCQHERVHTGAKPYKCSQDNCNKAYAYDVDLKRHLFAVHSIWTKKHPCPHAFCENVIFPERKILRKHLKTVHGIEES